MSKDQKVKFVSDVPVADTSLVSEKPFEIRSDEQRRYVRLEISAPTELQRVKDQSGNFWPEGEGADIRGTILNISAGGVLVDLEKPLECRDIVIMSFHLQHEIVVRNVLGRVKRCDADDACYLAGIEFVTREQLSDALSAGELEVLSDDMANFGDSVQRLLSGYVKRRKESE